jgi:hypothetical protein
MPRKRAPSPEFESRSDDDENLWTVDCILDEKKNLFLIKWAGIDPATTKPWANSWVHKSDVTDIARDEWRELKAQKAAQKRKAKGSLL